MLFEKELIQNFLKKAGDCEVKIRNQERTDAKEGLISNHETLITTFVAKNESGTTKTSNVNMHVLTLELRGARLKQKIRSYNSFFHKNAAFFEDLQSILTESYIGEMWSPAYFATKVNFTHYRMLFEDILHSGYVKRDNIFDNLVCITFALRALARFHCCSIISQARIKEDKRVLRSDESHGFGVHKTALEDIVFEKPGVILELYNIGIQLTCLLAEKQFDYDFDMLKSILKQTGELSKMSEKHCNVICHGDLRKENIYFAVNPRVPACILNNFHCVRFAPMALDLLQLIYLHTSLSFRKKHENELVRSYSSALEEVASKFENVPDGVKIPTVLEIKFAYEDLRLFGPSIALVYLSLSLLEREDIKTFITEFPKKSFKKEEFLSQDRFEWSQNKLLENHNLFEQFKDLAASCVQYCKPGS